MRQAECLLAEEKHGASEEETHYHYLHFTDEEMGDLSTQIYSAESYGYLSPQ